jgi:hypothetical protein
VVRAGGLEKLREHSEVVGDAYNFRVWSKCSLPQLRHPNKCHSSLCPAFRVSISGPLSLIFCSKIKAVSGPLRNTEVVSLVAPASNLIFLKSLSCLDNITLPLVDTVIAHLRSRILQNS